MDGVENKLPLESLQTRLILNNGEILYHYEPGVSEMKPPTMTARIRVIIADRVTTQLRRFTLFRGRTYIEDDASPGRLIF